MTCSKACTENDVTAKRTGAEVESALSGTDTSDLKVFFRQALDFSTPPLILYRNCRPGGYSNLIFGVPLVDLGMNNSEEKIPKVMRICIDEVEKRGMDVDKIYSVRLLSRYVFRSAKFPDYRISYIMIQLTKKYGRPVEYSAD